MRRWLGIPVLAAVLAALAACGQQVPVGEAPTAKSPYVSPPPTGDAGPGIQAWRGFPATATPRPVVLAGPAVLDPRRGFPHDDAKLAYGTGAITMPARLPAGPATADGFPVISAAAAASRLQPKGQPRGVPLRVTSVRLGAASFSTDRGPRTLPAWLFTFAGVPDPAAVLAVDRPARYVPAGVPDTTNGGTVHVSTDGRTLTVGYIGGIPGSGPCESAQVAAATESGAAVVIRLTPVPTATLSTPVACPAIGYQRTAPVALRAPLGGRVVITPTGDPYEVLR
jgi:predicted small lipoprotein YifL